MSFFKKSRGDLSQTDSQLKPENERLEEKIINASEFDDDKIVNTLNEETLKKEIKDAEYDNSLADSNIEPDFLDGMYGKLSEENLELDDITQIIDNAMDATEDDNVKNDRGQEDMFEKNTSSKDELTIISKGTIINGNISSEGSIEIMGDITGDIDCLGKLAIAGKVNGNSIAYEIYIKTPRLVGSLTSEGNIKIDDDSIVIGDVTAVSGAISGAVKGQVEVNGPIVIDSNAVIKGNITARTLQINSGAVVDGYCSIGFSDTNIDSIFDK